MKDNLKQLPIGVFDSGVGGLTVLRALQNKMPQESFLYLGDTARLPYGTKSPETIIRYVTQANSILVERGVKYLVVACSTASTVSLSALYETFPNIPIIGMLEPGAKAACSASKTGAIAVIATEATINGQGYQKAIQQLRADAIVLAQSCGLFVALAEEGCTEGIIAEEVAKMYLQPLLAQKTERPLDCLVLGCTHYPVLAKTIKKVVGSEIGIVDSAQITAETVAERLSAEDMLADGANQSKTTFLVTDAPDRFTRIAKQFLNREIERCNVELVELLEQPNKP